MVRQIDDVKVNIYHHGEGGACFYIAESDWEVGSADTFALLLAGKAEDEAYTLIIYEVTDWNAQLSPWNARTAFGEE